MANPMAPAAPGFLYSQPNIETSSQLDEARQFLDTLLSGGTPEGFVPTVQDWGRVINVLGDVASRYAWQNLPEGFDQAMTQWVHSALQPGMPVQLQQQAANLLMQQAQALNQPVHDSVVAWAQQAIQTPHNTIPGLVAQGEMLANMVPTFANQPWFQQAYANYLQQVAPGGNVAGMPVELWAAAAQPYYEMMARLTPEKYAQMGLPVVQFPETTANMPRAAADIVRAAHEAQAATHGFQVGPDGLVTETPRERMSRIARDFGAALQYWQPQGATPGMTPPAGPVVAQPGPTAAGQPTTGNEQRNFADIIANAFGSIGSWFRGTPAGQQGTQAPPQPAPTAFQGPGSYEDLFIQAAPLASNLRGVAARYTQVAPVAEYLLSLYENLGGAEALEQELASNRDQWLQSIGDTATFDLLLEYVRTKVPRHRQTRG